MSENSTTVINILYLPLEVLEKILIYVPDQLVVAQTCKTFYEISCRFKRYKTTIRCDKFWDSPVIKIEELEENESLLQSIISSKRKIVDMRLNWINHRNLKFPRILKILFERFGRNLSELTLDYVELFLEHVIDSSDLQNLGELTVEGCPLMVLDVFDDLPDNVLTKVSVKDCKEYVAKVLMNQRNIKELTWKYSSYLMIDIRNLQLVSLELCELSYSRELLTGQGSLTSLILHYVLEQTDIDTISTLEQLEHLEFELYFRVLNLFSLRKLTKLVKLVANDEPYNNCQSLETLQNLSLIELTVGISELDRETAFTLSSNCPNIRKLKIYYADALGTYYPNVLQEMFPKLESFSTTLWPEYSFINGFEHRNLKRLHLVRIFDVNRFQTLLEGCVVLETFKTYEIDWELLQVILTARPNLKVLCVKEVKGFNENFIRTFWELSKNLESFHTGWRSAEDVEKEIGREILEIGGGLPYLALMKAVRAKKTCCKTLF